MAADKPEGPRAFARFIEQLGEGDVHAELSEELYQLGKTLLAQSRARDTNVKGTLILKLKFDANPKGLVDIEHSIDVKVPKPKRAGAAMWLTKGGNLSPENQRQPLLPGIREVAAPADAGRDVDKPAVVKDV